MDEVYKIPHTYDLDTDGWYDYNNPENDIHLIQEWAYRATLRYRWEIENLKRHEENLTRIQQTQYV